MSCSINSPFPISRFGASHGSATMTLVRRTKPGLIDSVCEMEISRFGASHGCALLSEPGLAPKRLICSWTVDVKDIDPTTFDLSVKNPNGGEEVVHRSPQEIMDEIAALDGESALAVLALATVRAMTVCDGTGASAQTANPEVLTTIRGCYEERLGLEHNW